MKRSEIVALSRDAIRKLATTRMGVVQATQSQLDKLAQHKKKKAQNQEQPVYMHRAAS